MKQPHKTLLLWVVLIVAFLAIWQFLSPDGPQRQPMPFSEFMGLVQAPREQRHVDAVEIKEREYTFQIKNPASKGTPERGISIGPESDEVVTELLKNNVKVSFQKDETNPFLSTTLTILLPMLFLLVLFYLF
ncbi:MAG TPA: cell division protein FtsH, partial [Polyangiaceae bacterium]|nr:cell division protein FtsH [Polyangiaceae bacterium]